MNYEIYFDNVCRKCKSAQSWFPEQNKCTSTIPCLYLLDEMCLKFDIPQEIILDKRNKLNN